MRQCDIAIIGAGAAGMTAAIAAAREAERRKQILLIEKEAAPGKKLLATGNGRCNLANRNTGAAYYRGDRAFIEAVFRARSPEESLSFFRSIGIPVTDDGSGRLYPLSRRAGAVVAALRNECARLGIETLCETEITGIKKQSDGFLLNGRISARALIVASGGAAGLRRKDACVSYDLLASVGIDSSPRYPCLCGLRLAEYPSALKGVRNISRVTAFAGNEPLHEETGEVQFNADGVSGIPVMQASAPVSQALERGKACRLTLDLLPQTDGKRLSDELGRLADRYRTIPAQELFGGFLPKPLCVFLLKKIGVSPAAGFPREKAGALADAMKNMTFPVAGTADFPDAQVTGGGAYTDRFDPATLQARAVPGLFAAGEVLDVTGLCGGYNLMWAWSTGYAAGRAAGKF